MFRKTLFASVVAGLLSLGAAGVASAEPAESVRVQPPTPQWIAVFYFGTQTYCTQAGMLGQQSGALPPGTWKCDSGWLMVQPPHNG
jgi:hypothetical protein